MDRYSYKEWNKKAVQKWREYKYGLKKKRVKDDVNLGRKNWMKLGRKVQCKN